MQHTSNLLHFVRYMTKRRRIPPSFPIDPYLRDRYETNRNLTKSGALPLLSNAGGEKQSQVIRPTFQFTFGQYPKVLG